MNTIETKSRVIDTARFHCACRTSAGPVIVNRQSVTGLELSRADLLQFAKDLTVVGSLFFFIWLMGAVIGAWA